MNSELGALWGVERDVQPEEWLEIYQTQLFNARKELRSTIQIPKLFEKKWKQYAVWAAREGDVTDPETELFVTDFELNTYEENIAKGLMFLERSETFKDLCWAAAHLLLLQQSYSSWIVEVTKQWDGEWESVEVNSRSFFPMGHYLFSLKQGKQIQDWKAEFLKERKRINIVF